MSCACDSHQGNQKNTPKTLGRRDIVMGIATGTLALFAEGCSTNPVTGRNQLMLVNDAQLSQMSLAAWNDLKSKTPLFNNADAQAIVAKVGTKIAQVAQVANAQWEYAVFDEPTINAFVLPGGKVGVYRGLLDLVDNEAQLAAVLGHETLHVTGRHAAERLSQSTVAQLGMAAAQAGATRLPVDPAAQRGIVQALGLGVQYGVLLPFSRDQEIEADVGGLHYMAQAGYDPRQVIPLWQKMAAANNGNRPPEFLSTHPSENTRIARLTEELSKMGYQV